MYYFNIFSIYILVPPPSNFLDSSLVVLDIERRSKSSLGKEKVVALAFEKWNGDFSVSAEGTIKSKVLDGNQVLLSNFVEYIKVSFSLVGNRLRIFFFFGKTSLLLLNFRDFCRQALILKNSHLGVLNFNFLSLRYIKIWFSLILPFLYKKILILPLTPKLHSFVLG